MTRSVGDAVAARSSRWTLDQAVWVLALAGVIGHFEVAQGTGRVSNFSSTLNIIHFAVKFFYVFMTFLVQFAINQHSLIVQRLQIANWLAFEKFTRADFSQIPLEIM